MEITEALPEELLERFRARAADYDERNMFCTEDFAQLRDRGYLKALLPVERGGYGWGLSELALAQR
ncbi:acyl-CoA dehydrogenase, partial [Glutamicibacter creatinolyticus]